MPENVLSSQLYININQRKGMYMFTRQELEEMTSYSTEDSYIVSVYLTVDPATHLKDEYVAAFKNMAREELQKYDQKEQKIIAPEIERITEYMALNKTRFKKSLALFTSQDIDFWREFHLSVVLNDQIIINRRPYLKPLADLLDNYQRYGVVLVDRESARVFLVHLGEIEEYTEHFNPDIPGQHKKGGWAGLSQSRWDRHIEKHVTLHLKDVVNILSDVLLSREYIGRICIGGPVEAVSRFKEMLPQHIQEKVVGTFKADMNTEINEIKKKTLEIMKEVEREKEEELVNEIISRAHKGDRAALGLDDVMSNIARGNIQKLALKSGLKKWGYKCQSCESIFTSKQDKCPYCQGDIEMIDHFIDLMVQQALNQGALIEVVFHTSEKFKEAGNIGALLRY